MKSDLVEGFLLLALDNSRGTFLIDSIALNHGLAGASLMELAMIGRIRVKDRRVEGVDDADTGSPFLNAMLQIIHRSGRPGKVRRWVTRLAARLKKKRQLLIRQLITEGTLKAERRMILGMIPHTVYPTVDSTREERIRARLMAMIKGEEKVDPRYLLLLSLLEATKLTRVLFDNRKEYRQARRKIQELTSDFEVGNVLRTTIKEVCSVVITASTSAVVNANNKHRG
jgi:hypothetical protein